MSKKHNNESYECSPEKNIKEEIDYKNLYIRTLADYQNLQKRTVKDVLRARADTKTKIISEFLNVYDAAKIGAQYKEQGSILIYNAFKSVLEKLNIKIIDKEFIESLDPNMKFNEDYCDAIAATDTTNKLKDKIINTFMKDGFYDVENHKTLVHAKVSVWRYNDELNQQSVN